MADTQPEASTSAAGVATERPSSPTSPPSPSAQHQYQHPPLQVSFDSIPRETDDASARSAAALLTPPIQQQESILSALAQSVAEDSESDLDDLAAVTAGAPATKTATESQPRRRTSSALASSASSSSSSAAKSIKEKGNGWALLSQPRAATATTTHTLAPPAPLPSSAARNRKSTLSSSSTTLPPATDSDEDVDMLATISSPSSSSRTSTPTTLTAISSNGTGGPVDCDTPLRDSQRQRAATLAGSVTDPRARVGINGSNGMELPAEGSGLRGKDETGGDGDGNDGRRHDQQQQQQQPQQQQSQHQPSSSTSSSSTTTTSPQNGHNASSPSSNPPPTSIAASATPLNPPPARKLCIRHQRMADEGTVGKLQRSIESLPLTDQTAVNSVWSIFSSSSHARRALILQGILSMCCFSQLSLLSSELALAIRIDPFSLFPREVSLKVLSHLDAMSLGRAAQVSRSWRALADDDLLWRNMCEQHIERKCDKCGWGLPLLSEKRRRLKGPAAAAGTAESRQLTYAKTGGAATSLDGVNVLPAASTVPASSSSSSSLSPPSTSGNLKRSITAAANAAALERHSRAGTTNNSRASSPSHSMPTVPENNENVDGDGDGDGHDAAATHQPPKKRLRSEPSKDGKAVMAAAVATASASATPATRPWKSVYCERLAIERNWRRGRYTIRTLQGHTDGIMCLQFNESLSHPSFPVAITGSYDRTARIWNMDTGEELRVLRGHTRGVRCLQFDEAKLITGSMDRTLKIWNWRTGDLVRTLEGHTEGIVCLNFNDHLLASGSADSNVKIWNFKTGQCHTLRGHTDWVNAVTLWSGKGQVAPSATTTASADGAESTFLFSASDDGTIRLWDLAYNECLMVFTGHVGQCQGLSLVQMPEEVVETLANGGNVGPTGANVAGRGSSRGNQNGATTASTGANTTAGNALGDSTYFAPAATTASASSPAPAAAQSCGFNPPSVPGGRSANTGSAPAIPEHFYNAPASGQHRTALHQLHRAQRNKIEPHLLKLQERLQAAGLVDPLPIDAEMGDLEWGAAARRRGSAGAGEGGAGSGGSGDEGSSGNSNNAATAGGGGHARLRPMLFSCSLDNTIKIWDVRTGVCVRTLFGHMAGLWALSTDRLRLATASHDSTLKVWELATGKHLFSICEHRGPVTCVQIGDDKVVSGSDDAVVNVYSFTGEAK